MTATAAPPHEKRVPGESGTWVFLFGDMLVFGAFFVTFLVERATAPEAFDAARTTLHVGVGVTNTLVLLTSSLLVVLALNAMRVGAAPIATRAVAAAIVCGLAFIALKVFEYISLAAAGHGPGANDFYLYYFILTGLHLFHVCLGLGALSFVLTQTRRTELSPTRTALVEGGACFWHLVDLLWIFLFALLYLVS
ncbi:MULTISPECIES: cytochrome c oxidase subunit 3 [Mycolicibacterium]|uniref:Probable cytochrome c oxidase subunit 3 n=2 Tax=Mycolicibacterium TaxID=1866885 RepID=A1TEV5_MYCVP|nr:MULTISPECIES: cytochrome c oxidase subunit 3 [Mycolicibacterium]ABM15705.1 cytochrome c oxidase, subunit III [Mycolicibacterium vanbaalenii PYR-1]MCV7130366.1 cytochrome c oxidase subunit 3 [Mycolicibacterium vanbaalenii PYR-1]MDN4520723.1 cytochrome c oxidase subunit 3 [Mycolicibacterium austroafricanum]QRZ06026.1 cytochrome c oxidase subunit 3 [Mycolicibacterium austroafricanum]QZT67511.1 cytochrome c oxidase subunit 3 [Mycolicibacterium austroafricanum]